MGVSSSGHNNREDLPNSPNLATNNAPAVAKQNYTAPSATSSTPPDYKFEHFMKRCMEIQGQKKNLETQIRVELEKWREKARDGKPRDECRRNVVGLLSQFKASQLSQDALITKEKNRLDAFRNVVNEDTSQRLKARLEFFSQLNKEHDNLLYLFREDSQECQAICKKYSEVQIRKRTGCKFESWLRCPPCSSYDYGSLGSSCS